MDKKRLWKRIAAWLLAFAIIFTGFGTEQWGTEVVYAATPAGSGTKEEPYQIQDREDLEWFASLVNGTLTDGTAQNKTACAELTGDIDLENKEWIPIGNYSSKYTGIFDGNGYTIQNMSISSAGSYKALFGVIDSAVIKNLTVEGSVTAETNFTAGIAAKGFGKFQIENCANHADITNNNQSSAYAAGIVASSDTGADIRNCYNKGTICSAGRSSGIVADMTLGTISNCYNAGDISGEKAVGIAGAFSNTYENCYNRGNVTGTTSAYSICASKTADFTSAYYLEKTASDDDGSHGTSMTADEMKAASFVGTLGSDNWKADTTGLTNGAYPILKWQKIVLPTEKNVPLETPGNLHWIQRDADENTSGSGAAAALLADDEAGDGGIVQSGGNLKNDTMQAAWFSVIGAQGYVVKLYRYQDYYESLERKETPQPVYVSDAVAETSYSFQEFFENEKKLPTGLYMFTVTAIGDGEYYTDSPESDLDGGGYAYYGALKIDAPSNLTWNENTKTACWNHVPKATAYFITLYRNEEIVTELTMEEFDPDSEQISCSFLKEIDQTGDYYFALRAAYVVQDESSGQMNNIIQSDVVKSGILNYTSSETEWVDITSASQWIALANVTAKGTDYTSDADAQYVEWSKNYRLANDIDFSSLTAKEQAMTKTLGNVNAEFTGIFDGNGCRITGLTLSNGDSGLFGYVGETGTVRNVTIDSANVLFSDNAAVLCWRNRGLITGCTVLNTNITADQGAIIGGMVSRNYGTVEKSCVIGGTLTANSTTANGHAGFVGGNYGTIRQCYTTMDVSTKSYCAGGFAGWADVSGGGDCVFEDCFALGSVSAEKGWSGGFVGRINHSAVKFKNCYTANTVTSANKPDRVYGFTGALGSEAYNDDLGEEGAFSITVPKENFVNCYFAQDLTASDHAGSYAQGKTSGEMKEGAFTVLLGDCWEQSPDQNNGLPYLKEVTPPVKFDTDDITAYLLIAVYDRETYQFKTDTDVIPVTMESTGNTRVIDVLNAAKEQGLIDYTYTVTPAYGSFVESINGRRLTSPDGWMFTVNDALSNVSASLASVQDGDRILWYEGTTQNLFQAPSWASLTGGGQEEPSVLITDARQLEELAASEDDGALSQKYVLGADIDLSGIDFAGIGSYSHPFTGTFDGNGYQIQNLSISGGASSQGLGFFNVIRGATVKNVKLTNASVTGGSVLGLLAGHASVTVSSENMASSEGNLIGNCSVSGRVTSLLTGNESAYVGGLIGFNDGDQDPDTGISVYSSVDHCKADVTVRASAAYAGGLVGGNMGYITSCSSIADIEGTNCVGGFAGGNQGGVYDCHSDGTVSGTSSVGGFAGYSSGQIENCYSLCDVNVSAEDANKIGGFVGNGSGTIKNCMSAGTLYMTSYAGYTGGFAGQYEGTIAGLEKDIQMSGCYGNCLDADGNEIKAIGNKTSSTIEAEQKVLDEMQLTDQEKVAEKMSELFGVTIKVSSVKEQEETLVRIYQKMAADLKNDELAPWVISDLVAYESAYGLQSSLTEEQIQSYVDYAAKQGAETEKAGDLAKYIISLKALGYDASKIVTDQTPSGTYLDLVAKLNEMTANKTGGSDSIYTMPYILIAWNQDPAYASENTKKDLIKAILEYEVSGGGFGVGDAADADASAPAVLALSAYYHSDAEVKEAIDRALDVDLIRSMQGEGGAIYSAWTDRASAESTGLMLAAIASVGKDASVYKVGKKTLADGLMGLLNDSGDGFLYNGQTNALATEQGFRGLLALVQSRDNAFSLYDFSAKPSNVARTTQSGKKPEDNGSDGGTQTAQPGTGTPDTVNGQGRADTKNEPSGIVLKRQKIKSVRSTAKRTIRIKYTKNKKASGYQIRYSTSKRFKKSKKATVTGKSKTVKKIKGLKSGKKYYVQVRSYKKVGKKKYYGTWSKTKPVKVR